MDFCLILFAGNTEQAFLNNYEDIVDSSLPVQKVMNLFPMQTRKLLRILFLLKYLTVKKEQRFV